MTVAATEKKHVCVSGCVHPSALLACNNTCCLGLCIFFCLCLSAGAFRFVHLPSSCHWSIRLSEGEKREPHTDMLSREFLCAHVLVHQLLCKCRSSSLVITHSFTHSFTPSLLHSLTPSLPHSCVSTSGEGNPHEPPPALCGGTRRHCRLSTSQRSRAGRGGGAGQREGTGKGRGGVHTCTHTHSHTHTHTHTHTHAHPHTPCTHFSAAVHSVCLCDQIATGVPPALAAYPQRDSLPVERVEPEFQNRRDSAGKPIERVFFNKGL